MTPKTPIRDVALRAGSFLLACLLASIAVESQEASDGRPGDGGPGKAPERLEVPGIENVFRLSPNLYSGAGPHGAEALTALKALGVRTIVSVDGVEPDVETAKRLA